MPATERSFADVPPARLYLDTNVLISYLVSTDPHHERCARFLVHLAEAGLTRIYVSTLSWLEFAHVVKRDSFRHNLPDDVRRSFGLDRWEDPQIRKQYLEWFLGAFQQLLSQFDWSEVALTSGVRAAALQHVAAYNLDTHDAVHLASALQEGVVDLASFDSGFRRVDGLVLWNDLVHSQSPSPTPGVSAR